jgi:hypothetical protein
MRPRPIDADALLAEYDRLHEGPPGKARTLIENAPTIEPEPCDDAVSRRGLLSDLKELTAAWGKYPVMAEQIKGVETAIRYVETIPSVTPERKKGKWIEEDDGWDGVFWRCSECNEPFYLVDGTPVDNEYHYCPNCGTDMRGDQDANANA